MKIPFLKYQGTGNDFILIDNRSLNYNNLDVAKLCHPKFGIGADGLMLLQNTEGYDFEMVYYNSDGNISTMCGNGGRCIVDFAKSLNVFTGEKTLFKAIDGAHDAVWSNAEVQLKMQDVANVQLFEKDYILNTGSPHYVVFVQNIDTLNIVEMAKAIRYNETYKAEGINVNFVEIINPLAIKVRTYERGVENETLSCGTGVTACAIALSKKLNFAPNNYTIETHTPGGILKINFTQNQTTYTNVWLCGVATRVFEGEMENF